MPKTHVEASVYLHVTPRYSRYYRSKDDNGNELPDECYVTKITQKRPTDLKDGAVAVKIRLKIPVGAFLPLQPEAVIEIPESLVLRDSVVTLVGEDPEEGN